MVSRGQLGLRDIALDQNVETSPYSPVEPTQPCIEGSDAGLLKHIAVALFVLLIAAALKRWAHGWSGSRFPQKIGDWEKRAKRLEPSDTSQDEAFTHDRNARLGTALFQTTGTALLLVLYLYWIWLQTFADGTSWSHDARKSSIQNVFQLYQPPAPLQSPCTRLLVSHTFENSYGRPFVGSYEPPDPIQCPHINSATLHLTVTSRGRQFDRLALLFLSNTEIFRTSTAEPSPNGIAWTYEKDVSAYMSLWRRDQKVIMDLGNLVNDVLTGSFEVRIEVSFAWKDGVESADLILPISKRISVDNKSSAYVIPRDRAGAVYQIPGNSEDKPVRAFVSIAACGQGSEEFWYSNTLDEDTGTFRNTTGDLYGFSPFREVQLWINGRLAGVAWPFPIIFTGGIAPGLWRPIVGIDAFDLRETEIDITSWLPSLTDKRSHLFQLKVVGLRKEGTRYILSETVGDNWVVTGKVFVFFNESESLEHVASRTYPRIFAPDPVIAVSSVREVVDGTARSLMYSVNVSRSINITSESGSWIQNLDYTSNNLLTRQGLSQSTTQSIDTDFTSIDFHSPDRSFSVAASYPLQVNTTVESFEDEPGIRIDSSISRGLKIKSTGRLDSSLFTLTAGASELDTWQSGVAQYSSRPNRSYSFGDTKQEFFENSQQGIMVTVVEAVNGSIDASQDEAYSTFADSKPRDVVGRGRVPSSLNDPGPKV